MDKDRKAIALFYDGQQAPELTAVGEHAVAERILALAREHQVPIYENAPLVEMLAQQRLGERIPEELYRIVAEIIAFVYVLQGRRPAAHAESSAIPSPIKRADRRSDA